MDVFRLFPTPLMRAKQTLESSLVTDLVAHMAERATRNNVSSKSLAHTELLKPADAPLLEQVASKVTPKLVDFGVCLFGERLAWSIKEMWVNVLEHGGRQAMHNHANSFASGVIYLTPTHPSSQTVFIRSPGGADFVFKNDNPGITPNEFCADRWVSPPPEPGDMLLFPSYLMHAVPPNQGERRITLSFNAIPSALKSWDYTIRFSG
jgi:uncharacterized protein (TIGR02466 family)